MSKCVYIDTKLCKYSHAHQKISYLRIWTIMRPVPDGSQALFVLLEATTSRSVCDPLLWDRVNPELCSEGMQKRCAVRLRCTKSDIFSHLLQPQTIPAHKNYCHVPKIEDAPISRVKPLARLREARLQIRRQKRDSNSFRTTDGKKPLTAVLSDRTGQIPGQQCRHQNWYQGVKDADTDISHISYQTLLTQICNECFTALFFLRTCIMCYSYYCYSLNWVMFCSGLILIISNQAER